MSIYYRCYGLVVASEIELPELLPIADPGCVDVHITLGAINQENLQHARQIGPRLWAGEGMLWLHIPGVVRFLIRGGEEILIDPEMGSDGDNIRLYLMGSAFGALLFQRGLLVLHGNAIRVGDGCMVCLGHSGAGKSTLAAAFLQRGHQILSDDVTPIDAECRAIPGFPRLKLWQDAAERMNINVGELRRVREGEDKYYLSAAESFAVSPLPVKWVYVLERGSPQGLRLEPVQGMERFRLLHQNTYRARYLKALELRAEHLKLCGVLSGRVRLAKLIRQDSGDTLDELVESILADVAEHS